MIRSGRASRMPMSQMTSSPRMCTQVIVVLAIVGFFMRLYRSMAIAVIDNVDTKIEIASSADTSLHKARPVVVESMRC